MSATYISASRDGAQYLLARIILSSRPGVINTIVGDENVFVPLDLLTCERVPRKPAMIVIFFSQECNEDGEVTPFARGPEAVLIRVPPVNALYSARWTLLK